jgi:3-oxosteroid 1-dehydrogenase
MPGQEIPAEMGTKADSIEELARLIGVDADGLAATVESFNRHSEKGEDPEFHRGEFPWSVTMCGDPNQKPNANLGPLIKGPYYAVPLYRMAGGGIASAGLVGDEHCRVIGWDDKPIEGLYVAGNSMARLDNGAVMQSGMTNARGMTHGYLAGLHAVGKPSDLLTKELGRIKEVEAVA